MSDGETPRRPQKLRFSEAASELRPLLDGPEEAFEAGAATKLPGLCKSALAALGSGVVEASDIDTFWAFLARLAVPGAKLKWAQVAEVTATAAANTTWAERFWQHTDQRVSVWVFDSQPEAAVEAAAWLLLRSPAGEGELWLSGAPESFRTAALARCVELQRASSEDAGDPLPTTLGRAADTDVSPASESLLLLGGGEKKSTRKSLRSRIWSGGKARDDAGAEVDPGAEGDPGALESGPPPPPASSESTVLAACAFRPSDTTIIAPGDGVLVTVAKGDRLLVLGHHPGGWTRVRPADGPDDALEGWLPEGVCLAIGEVGRRIAARAVVPTAEREMQVQEGALVKLLERDGERWWAEVDGCRGYVPNSALREARPGEEAGLTLLGARMARALSSAASQGSKERERKASPWMFGLWGYMASFYASWLCLVLGTAGVAAFFRPDEQYPERLRPFSSVGRHFLASAFSLVCGAIWLIFNLKSKMASRTNWYTPRGTPVRGVVTLLLSLPLLASGLTFLAGISVLFVSLLFFLSARRREQGSAPESVQAPGMRFLTADEELKGKSRLLPGYWLLWWELQGVRGERPKLFILLVWFVANVALGTYKYLATQQQLLEPSPELVEKISTQCWMGELSEPGNDDCTLLLDLYQRWIPWAKFFGMTLNFNCALIILMVCQQFIANVTSHANRSAGVMGKIARKLPTHKNLTFHKGLAVTIALQSFIHTFAHYMAQSWTLPTLVRFGSNGKWVTLSIWATGAAIIMCIVVMYPVSREYVRKAKFEAFIYTHIACATIFMLCLLWHGPVFYLWAALPLGLYLVDRYVRWQVSAVTPAKLLQVCYRPPVLQLTFDSPWRYRAGQYVWLCCPSVKLYEKHPFTISSAPETELLSLAIKCWPGGWTEKLRDYLAGVCEKAKAGAAPTVSKGFAYSFDEVDWLTGQRLRGLTEAPGGGPLLLLDGPHAAPAMRYLEFGVVILAAAGIGLTPASSVLRSLLQHRWRTSENARPHSIYFCWLCACAEVPAFEWFADELSDSEVAAAANASVHGGKSEPARNCELHLFSTRAPAAEDPRAVKPPTPQRARIYGRLEQAAGEVWRPYTGAELLQWMQHPATKSEQMPGILNQPQGSRPNEAGHTCVWNGRPNWDALFAHVAKRHRARGGKVGVFFCGAPAIAKDLRRSCNAHSDKEIRFLLMKESF